MHSLPDTRLRKIAEEVRENDYMLRYKLATNGLSESQKNIVDLTQIAKNTQILRTLSK